MGDVQYWHMQLHPNDRSAFNPNKVIEILNKTSLIGSHRSISFDMTNYAAFSVNKKALCTFITWTQGRPWVSP